MRSRYFPLHVYAPIEGQSVLHLRVQATIKDPELQCNCCMQLLDFASVDDGPGGRWRK